MANLLLNDILNEKLNIEDVIKWLTEDDSQDIHVKSALISRCTQCEFVLYFLNFLRDQVKSVLQASYNLRQTPTNAILHVPSIVNVTKTKQSSEINHLNGTRKGEDVQSLQTGLKTHSTVSSSLEIATPNSKIDKLKHNPQPRDVNAIIDTKVLSKHDTSGKTVSSQTSSRLDILQNMSDNLDPLPHKTTSTPMSGGRYCENRSFDGPITAHTDNINNCKIFVHKNVSESSPFSATTLSSKATDSYTHSNNCSRYNENVVISNCLLVAKTDNTPLSADRLCSHNSKTHNSSINSSINNCSNDELSRLTHLNTSVWPRNVSKNESLSLNSSIVSNVSYEFSMSPIYINDGPITPQSSKTLYSKSVERPQNWKSIPRHSLDKTPKQGSHNLQRNSKTTPRRNVSLGDYIAIDTRNAKKGSGKKSNVRLQTSKASNRDDSFADGFSITAESFPEIGTGNDRRRRRIKPTKLDVSDNADSNNCGTFGVISRPQTVNPQFSEISPTEKSDTIPFELERDLLRLERQKQRQSVVCEPLVEPAISTVASRALNRKILSEPTVMPDIHCVENIQELTILAEIYSKLLDLNWVLNPMTELYFVISLITLQRSFGIDKCQASPHQEVTQNDEISGTTDTDDKSSDPIELEKSDDNLVADGLEHCSELEYINEELGCRILNDDNELVANDELTSELETEPKETLEKPTELSSGNEENNYVNKEVPVGQSAETRIENKNYFETLHNCIFFATKFLNMQRVLLGLLDRATLKLLCENNRIATFLPELQKYLNTCYKKKLTDSSRLKHHFNSFSIEANVNFQIDTDNKQNFPSHNAFHTFRKQRDLFYEALRIWEINHPSSGWIFSIALGGKIRRMLTLHNDAANYSHFARLFKSQLLTSCIVNGPQGDSMGDESFDFLKSLKHIDPEKLTRLHERLVTPQSSKGPVPPPSFGGVQEFYRDFILHASNPMFHAHLQDCLVHEIMELNDTQFTSSEIEDSDTTVDEETKQNFVICISSLRLLAKFLAFLISLPYRGEPHAAVSVLTTQIELRSKVLPPLNLQHCLQIAAKNRKLVLTVPWVVEYLAMLDPVSLRLPYSRRVFEMLFHVYCECSLLPVSKNTTTLPAMVLIRFSIGWLFEVTNFPLVLYFNWRMSGSYDTPRLDNGNTTNSRGCESSTVDWTSDICQSNESSLRIDSLDIVDERILYVCCPFLSELKALLTTDNVNVNSSTTFRHITPVSSDLQRPAGSSTSAKQLQMQLEEAFFHGQPISTRKTVEFVSERVASSCVKHIRNTTLPCIRSDNSIQFQKRIAEKTIPEDINEFKTSISAEIQSIAANLFSVVRKRCEADALEMCKIRVAKSMEALLAEDTQDSVRDTCVEIAMRMATERTLHWIQSHITNGSMFVEDMNAEIEKLDKGKTVVEYSETIEHDENASSPKDVIIELRSIIWDLLDNQGSSLTLEKVLLSLDHAHKCLIARADLLPVPKKVIGLMTVDLMLFLAAYRTDMFLPEVQEKLIRLWKIKDLNFSENNSVLTRILCPRNTMLLELPGNAKLWIQFGQLMNKMLKEQVISIDALSDQCTMLLRYDWPVEILKHLSTCLSEGIKDFKSSSEESEKMKLLLEWIAETCNDMEFIID